jgi:predicted esterase
MYLMHRLLAFLLTVSVAGPVAAEIPSLQVHLGEMVEGIACHTDRTQTYTLYVPSTYAEGRLYPVLLVFDPRGRSLRAAELFRDAAETYGWIIVSSDNTRSDGPWEPNAKAIEALWPEIHIRLPIDNQRIYAAGFSGGAAVAGFLARSTEKVVGIVACGGRALEELLEGGGVAVFATAGDTDFNYVETNRLDEFLSAQGSPHRLVIFKGSHSWMPSSVAREAVEWFEILAMRDGARNRDPHLVDSLFESNLARARALASEGRHVDAARRLREMERTYDGLSDTSTAKEIADGLETGDPYRRQRKALTRAVGSEEACLARWRTELALFQDAELPPPTRQLVGSLRLEDLMKRSNNRGADGLAARRCLNSLYAQLSFYLPREDMPRKRYSHAATAYELSLEIRQDNPVVWYNLACARAQLRQKSAAVEALARSIELGFNNPELLATDTDLDPLRKRKDFQSLIGDGEMGP